MEQKGDKRGTLSWQTFAVSAEELLESLLRIVAEIIEAHVLIVRQLLHHGYYPHPTCTPELKFTTMHTLNAEEKRPVACRKMKRGKYAYLNWLHWWRLWEPIWRWLLKPCPQVLLLFWPRADPQGQRLWLLRQNKKLQHGTIENMRARLYGSNLSSSICLSAPTIRNWEAPKQVVLYNWHGGGEHHCKGWCCTGNLRPTIRHYQTPLVYPAWYFWIDGFFFFLLTYVIFLLKMKSTWGGIPNSRKRGPKMKPPPSPSNPPTRPATIPQAQ